MSEPIGKGDWVECVDVSPLAFGVHRLRLHALYEVRAAAGTVVGEPGVSLVGHDEVIAFRVSRFRPIYRPKAELIESLKVAARSVAPQVVRERSREGHLTN